MSPALQRALRTFIQAAIGSFIASNALSAVGTEGVIHWDILQKAGISAFAAGLIALLSWIQNGAEDAQVIPAVLKPPAPSVPLTAAIEASADDAVHALAEVGAAVKAAPRKSPVKKKAAPRKAAPRKAAAKPKP